MDEATQGQVTPTQEPPAPTFQLQGTQESNGNATAESAPEGASAEQAPSSLPPPPPADEAPHKKNWLLIGGIIGVAVIVIGGAAYFGKGILFKGAAGPGGGAPKQDECIKAGKYWCDTACLETTEAACTAAGGIPTGVETTSEGCLIKDQEYNWQGSQCTKVVLELAPDDEVGDGTQGPTDEERKAAVESSLTRMNTQLASQWSEMNKFAVTAEKLDPELNDFIDAAITAIAQGKKIADATGVALKAGDLTKAEQKIAELKAKIQEIDTSLDALKQAVGEKERIVRNACEAENGGTYGAGGTCVSNDGTATFHWNAETQVWEAEAPPPGPGVEPSPANCAEQGKVFYVKADGTALCLDEAERNAVEASCKEQNLEFNVTDNTAQCLVPDVDAEGKDDGTKDDGTKDDTKDDDTKDDIETKGVACAETEVDFKNQCYAKDTFCSQMDSQLRLAITSMRAGNGDITEDKLTDLVSDANKVGSCSLDYAAVAGQVSGQTDEAANAEIQRLQQTIADLSSQVNAIRAQGGGDAEQRVRVLEQQLSEAIAAIRAQGGQPNVTVNVAAPAGAGAGQAASGASATTTPAPVAVAQPSAQPAIECPTGFEYDSERQACVTKMETVAVAPGAAETVSQEAGAAAGSGTTTSAAAGGGTATSTAAAGTSQPTSTDAKAGASGGTSAKAASGTGRLHGAYIQGQTGPELLLYPVLLAGANVLFYLRKRKKNKQ